MSSLRHAESCPGRLQRRGRTGTGQGRRPEPLAKVAIAALAATNCRDFTGVSSPTGTPLRVTRKDSPRSRPRMMSPLALRSSRWVIVPAHRITRSTRATGAAGEIVLHRVCVLHVLHPESRPCDCSLATARAGFRAFRLGLGAAAANQLRREQALWPLLVPLRPCQALDVVGSFCGTGVVCVRGFAVCTDACGTRAGGGARARCGAGVCPAGAQAYRSLGRGWLRVGDMMCDGGKRRDKPAWSRR